MQLLMQLKYAGEADARKGTLGLARCPASEVQYVRQSNLLQRFEIIAP